MNRMVKGGKEMNMNIKFEEQEQTYYDLLDKVDKATTPFEYAYFSHKADLARKKLKDMEERK
jgi:hypothetical protein